MREGHHDTDRRAALAAAKDSTVALLWRKEEKLALHIFIFIFFALQAEGTFQCEDFYYNAVKIVPAYSAVP